MRRWRTAKRVEQCGHTIRRGMPKPARDAQHNTYNVQEDEGKRASSWLVAKPLQKRVESFSNMTSCKCIDDHEPAAREGLYELPSSSHIGTSYRITPTSIINTANFVHVCLFQVRGSVHPHLFFVGAASSASLGLVDDSGNVSRGPASALAIAAGATDASSDDIVQFG